MWIFYAINRQIYIQMECGLCECVRVCDAISNELDWISICYLYRFDITRCGGEQSVEKLLVFFHSINQKWFANSFENSFEASSGYLKPTRFVHANKTQCDQPTEPNRTERKNGVVNALGFDAIVDLLNMAFIGNGKMFSRLVRPKCFFSAFE